jgi:hypothetical protein
MPATASLFVELTKCQISSTSRFQTFAGFQTVQRSHEGHWLKIRQLCQPYLTHSFVIGQIYEEVTLWQPQPESARSLVEAMDI